MALKMKHVEAELLAYLDDELSARERARVEAHLARCSQCAQALEALRALREDLAFTFDAALTPVRLPREADDRIRERLVASATLEARRPRLAWWEALWRRRFVFAQAVLAVMVVVFSLSTYQVLSVPPPPGPYETLVLGQERFAPGSEAALRVVVRAADLALPLAGAEVAVSLVAAPDLMRRVYQGWTDTNGTAEVVFTVPEDLEGQVDLVVETRAPGEEGLRSETSSNVRRESPDRSVNALVAVRRESPDRSVNALVAVRRESPDRGVNALAAVRRGSPDRGVNALAAVRRGSPDRGGDVAQRIVHPITIARAYKIYLSSDKPAYRPAQTVHMRALVLDATTLKPAVGEQVTFLVLDDNGEIMVQQVAPISDFGVAALDVPLPEEAEVGSYTLRAVLEDTVSERAVTVKDYELPPFRVDLGVEEDFYAPGETVTGTVEAAYFFGKPVDQGYVTVRAYRDVPEHVLTVVAGETDTRGYFTFTFALPALMASATVSGTAAGDDEGMALTLEAEVVDRAGQRAGLRQPLPVTPHLLRILAVPESGVLKPGVENLVYLLVSDPIGRPVSATLEVAVDSAGATERETLTTDAYGFAVLRFTPTASFEALEVTVRDAEGLRLEDLAQQRTVFEFEADRAPQVLLLRAERAAYTVGETLYAEALVANPNVILSAAEGSDVVRPVYLDIIRAGQIVATLSAPSVDGRATFALDLDGTLVGGLTLRAYVLTDEGTMVDDTRLVVVDAPRQMDVEVTMDQPVYRPGETARIHVQTAMRGGVDKPSASPPYALGLAVVDTSVYALETLPPSFARAYFLLEEAMLKRRDKVPGLDLPRLLRETEEARQAQDLAARAAWAGASAEAYPFMKREIAHPAPMGLPAQRALVRGLGGGMIGVSLLLSAVVLWGLGVTGVRSPALRRLGLGILGFVLAVPVLGPVFAGGLWVLGQGVVQGVFGLIVLGVALLWGFVIIAAWHKRDDRLRLSTALLTTYLVLGSLLVLVVLRSTVTLSAETLFIIGVAFLLTVAGLALLGQGLILEGRRRVGWAVTALALLLMPLVVAAAMLPGEASALAPMVRYPGLYAGPVGWLTGCSASAPSVEQEAPTAVEDLVEQEEVVEGAPDGDATEVPLVEEEREAAAPATLTPMPTPSPAATPLPLPAEPYPLRHIFPETLFWDPEALTDEKGALTFDLPLADTITTWQLTALASTREGDLGAATAEIRVFQDFFIAVAIPGDVITSGQTITGTVVLYNYASTARDVAVALVPAAWYTPVLVPAPVTVGAGDVVTAAFAIRPEESGAFELQMTAEGDGVGDAVIVEVRVGD